MLFQHLATLSLLAVGGAITTAPDMHRHLVLECAWLSDSAFSASIALSSQAAPGPNVLFVAVLGWHVGLNAAGGLSGGGAAVGWALLGAGLCLLSTVLPSSVLSYAAAQWAHRHREVRAVRTFRDGLRIRKNRTLSRLQRPELARADLGAAARYSVSVKQTLGVHTGQCPTTDLRNGFPDIKISGRNGGQKGG